MCERNVAQLPLERLLGPGPKPRHVPDWELNQCPFGLQAGTQSTEPHESGLSWTFGSSS